MSGSTGVRMSPKDFFLHLAAMVALYVSASSILILLFQIINVSFPDALQSYSYYYDPYSGAIRWSIASLIIIFPLYIFLTRALNNEYARNSEKRNLGVRKWLIYLTLFFAGAVMVGDLIVLLNTFLGGEISTRFILKTLSVFVVAVLIFGYYLRDIKSDGVLSMNERMIFRYGTIAFVLVAIVSGFVIMGSPQKQRLLQFDSQKTQDLQSIQWEVVQYWQQKQKLPDTLTELNDSIGGYFSPVDSQTKKPYEYMKTGAMTFTLCADFNTESKKEIQGVRSPTPIMLENDNWQHDKGRSCFERTIDPERYPPFVSDTTLYPKGQI